VKESRLKASVAWTIQPTHKSIIHYAYRLPFAWFGQQWVQHSHQRPSCGLCPFAILGAILPGHPFDVIYNYGLRHVFHTPLLPRYPTRRHFACFVATIMLVAAALGFQYGMPMVGYVVGWSLVAAAFVNVSTGFCVPSFIYRLVFGKVVCE
jgi:hypothetical protein